MKLKSIILLGFLSYILLGCSPAMRLERLTRKHPELITNSVVDTVTIESNDTFYMEVPGINDVIFDTDTIVVHDSLSTITIIKKGSDSVRVVTKYRPILFPYTKKTIEINRKQTVMAADHPIDKWKYRRQGIYFTLLSILFLIIILFIIKNYSKL